MLEERVAVLEAQNAKLREQVKAMSASTVIGMVSGAQDRIYDYNDGI